LLEKYSISSRSAREPFW